MESLISLIVPVYNVRPYLARCLDSILMQTYQNLEIILVDDGSTDGSSEVCEIYQQKDSRIVTIHKNNEGLVSARQAGISIAKGMYILNVDSDDWIEPNMVEYLFFEAKKYNADLVTSGFYREYSNSMVAINDSISKGNYETVEEKQYLYKHMIFNESEEKRGIVPCIWTKLFKRELLYDIYMRLDKNISFGEDLASVYSCIVKARCIRVTHQHLYHYCVRQNSIVNTKDLNFFAKMNSLYLFLLNNFMEKPEKEILKRQLDILMVQNCLWGINYLFGINSDCVIPYYNFDHAKIKENMNIVLYGAGKIGQAYYKQIKSDKRLKLVGWVDRNFEKYQDQPMKIESVESLKTMKYDQIIIAVKYEDIGKDIKNDLINNYHIPSEKIFWYKPISILDQYVEWE